MSLSRVTCNRLHIQGLVDVDDETLADVAPWLRLAWIVCAALALVGVVLGSYKILWSSMILSSWAMISPVHPVDLFYNHFLRRFTGTGSLPKRAAPTRFACGLGTVWLFATGWLFYTGAALAGYIVGGVLVVVAGLVGTIHLCIPSMIYGAIFGRPQPKKKGV